jgi:hypothetical protein
MIVNIFAFYINEDTMLVVPVSIIIVHILKYIEGEKSKWRNRKSRSKHDHCHMSVIEAFRPINSINANLRRL